MLSLVSISWILALASVTFCVVLPRSDNLTEPLMESSSYLNKGSGGVVATEVDVCSDIGVDVLQQGGSAADAIVAAGLCVGSIDAFHSGIGGGGFMLVRNKWDDSNNMSGHDVKVIDFRETAPEKANETMYSDSPNKNASTIG